MVSFSERLIDKACYESDNLIIRILFLYALYDVAM